MTPTRLTLTGICFLLWLPVFAATLGEVRVVQKTPVELQGYGITFEKLDFTFPTPVTARFWMEYDAGKGKPPQRSDVSHDHVLPTNHYALSYLQLANNQVAVSVTTNSEPPTNRRSVSMDGNDHSGTRTVMCQITSPDVGLNTDIELFRSTTKPPWRQPDAPTQVVRIMAHFSDAKFPIDPIPLEDNAGWQKVTDGRLAILRKGRNSFDWKDVSPKALADVAKANPDESFWEDLVDLTAIDANEAWVALVIGNKMGKIEHTLDGGRHWQETESPALDAVKISFVNAQCGFLLTLGSPGAGSMMKAVYGTTDGGVHWQPLPAPSGEGQSFYPTGMVFRTAQEGWITATYHGAPDAPLFHTTDGGKSWQVQELEIPPDFRGGYADVYPPFIYPIYPDRMKGELPVKLVRATPAPGREQWIYYYTEDGGAIWHLSKPSDSPPEN